MTLLYTDRCFLDHETGLHPERADRIRELPERLERAGLAQRCRLRAFEPVARRQLDRVHSARYTDAMWAFARSGGGDIDSETVVGPASYQVALKAAGSVCDAVEQLVEGEDTQALCLVRPPGHHALVNRAMGFCLFNNVAIAAKTAIDELELDRVMIVDWDIHHGNGTQDMFWEDPQVGFFSIHRWPFYPGSGDRDETGGGPGLGTTVNLPVEFGISRKDYITLFSDQLDRFAAKIRPQMVFVSAGFDSHRRDPIGNLGLETEDFGLLTEAVLDVADTHADGKLVSVLEGGYNPDALAECVEIHLATMLDRRKSGTK